MAKVKEKRTIMALVGLQASGKSTFAKEWIADHHKWLRVNRDSIRDKFFGGVWSNAREKGVIAVEKSILETMLHNGYNVIIDDTNLSFRTINMWKDFAEAIGANFETREFHTPFEVCVERDAARLGKERVGKAIISKTALFNGLINWGNKPIAIVDIDGTIADGSHREHILQAKPVKWDKYFSLMGNDAPIMNIIQQVQELSKTHTICIMTGRPDTYQYITMDWLNKYDVPCDYLFMRSASERIPDYEVKERFYLAMPASKVAIVFDDRQSVNDLCWRKHNVNLIDCGVNADGIGS